MLRLISPIVLPRSPTSIQLQETLTVGSSADSQLIVRGVEPNHARLYKAHDEWIIENVDGQTFIHGEPITGPTTLCAGDVLTFGTGDEYHNPYVYILDDVAQQPKEANLPKDTIFRFDHNMRIFHIKEPENEMIDLVTQKLCDVLEPLPPPRPISPLRAPSYDCMACGNLLLLPHAYEACGHAVCVDCRTGKNCPGCGRGSVEMPSFCKLLDQIVQTKARELMPEELEKRKNRYAKPFAMKRKREQQAQEVCVLQHTRLGRRFEAFAHKLSRANCDRSVAYNRAPGKICAACATRIGCGEVIAHCRGSDYHAECMAWPIDMVPRGLGGIRVNDARFCLHV